MKHKLGHVIDQKYRIVRILGEGGMGVIYEAEHVLLGRKVALKVMHPEYVSNPEALGRFFREAKAASEIGHPNIVEIQDLGSEGENTVFLVMELLHGINLEQLLGKEGKLPHPRAAAIALQILSALHAAHNKGIIHRDLKSDNIFLAIDSRGREEIKLLDFGIAKVKGEDENKLRLTKTGNIVGTPYYLSPEQAKGRRDIDERIDIWGVGVLLFEMLSGRLPFRGENYNEVLGKILLEPPVPLAELAPEVPDELIRIVEKAMDKDRDRRFAAARDMMEALIPFCDSQSELMSTGVREQIQTSIMPPPPPAGAHPDPQRETWDRILKEAAVASPSKNAKPLAVRQVVALAALAAALGAAAVALFFLFSPERSAQRTQTSPLIKASVASALPKSAPQNRQISDSTGAAIQPEVQIELNSLPPGAAVTVNGRSFSWPLRMPRSNEKVRLLVTAQGYFPFDKEIILDQNQVIQVEMKKIKTDAPEKNALKSKGAFTKSPKTKPATKKNKTDDWESNPFN